MTDIEKVVQYIDSKITYLKHNVVTDGVHDVPINNQIIALLRDIQTYAQSTTISRLVDECFYKRRLCFHRWEGVDCWENNLPGCIEMCTKYACKKCGKVKVRKKAVWPR